MTHDGAPRVTAVRRRRAWRTTLACVVGALLVVAVTWLIATRRNAVTLAGPDGALRPCPASPNCVSTGSEDTVHAMAPIPFADAPEAAQARARAALLAEPRMRIITERAGYLHAEARTLVFRFVDDVEIVVDADARVFRFRSASRQGRTDIGVNRKRMTRVGDRLRAAGGGGATATRQAGARS
jgi:uncharacterized protein (DUF1499 family)